MIKKTIVFNSISLLLIIIYMIIRKQPKSNSSVSSRRIFAQFYIPQTAKIRDFLVWGLLHKVVGLQAGRLKLSLFEAFRKNTDNQIEKYIFAE